jgi:hypothetical protein
VDMKSGWGVPSASRHSTRRPASNDREAFDGTREALDTESGLCKWNALTAKRNQAGDQEKTPLLKVRER